MSDRRAQGRAAPRSVRCFVVTVSDTRTRGHRHQRPRHRRPADSRRPRGRPAAHRQGRPDAGAARSSAQLADRRRRRSIITTGGTGITSRDSTFEAIDALLEKRLDGFGELFRMLSYQEIGPAAMMSRATRRHSSAGASSSSLPGSEAAVRLAMERLLLPELGHLVQQASTSKPGLPVMRPFTSTISLDEARRRLAAARCGRSRDRARRRSPRRGTRGRGRRGVADRRAAVRPLGDGRLRRRRGRHGRRHAGRAPCACASSSASTPARCRRATVDARHVRRDRDRRAAAGGRRRRGDGRGNQRPAGDAVRILAPARAGPEHRPPRGRHPPGDLVVRAATC